MYHFFIHSSIDGHLMQLLPLKPLKKCLHHGQGKDTKIVDENIYWKKP